MKKLPVYLLLLVLCSCATAKKQSNEASALKFPVEAPFNKNAGWGGPNDCLCVSLHMENGRNLLFLLDTGMPFTVLDKSLEPNLGARLGQIRIGNLWSGNTTVNEFAAPTLYLADIPLSLGSRVLTDDLSQIPSDHPLMGILGMDCLRHYCIQLDFTAKEIRILDPRHLRAGDLGTVFPLNLFSGQASTHADFFGQKGARFKIDTGCTIDGALKPKLFQMEEKKQTPIFATESKTGAGGPVQVAIFKRMIFDNETNFDLILSDCPENLLGLRFLMRHLVTLNFPQRTMYLRPRSLNSLTDEFQSMKSRSE